MGRKFHFKILPDSSLDKTRATCTAEFSYHGSNLSLAYHLRTKHPTESTSTGPRQSTLQDCGAPGRITTPVSEKLTNSLITWTAKNCPSISIVEEDWREREVIRAALQDLSYNVPSRGTIVSRQYILYEAERAQRTSMSMQERDIALTGDHWYLVNYLGVAWVCFDSSQQIQEKCLSTRVTVDELDGTVENFYYTGEKL